MGSPCNLPCILSCVKFKSAVKGGKHVKVNMLKPFGILVGQARPVRSDPPPEASFASGASNPHGEA